MSSIFNFINKDEIDIQHNYSINPSMKSFSNVYFRTSLSSSQQFQIPIALSESKKYISISNKQLSFLPFHMRHFLGNQYALELKKQSLLLSQAEKNTFICIEEPVFLFFDYESTCGSGHTYDLLFYLLYHFIKSGIKAKLLCVNLEKENIWYKKLLSLIQSYYPVEYIFINEDINYNFKNFYAIQSYQNIFFPHVKEFIKETLITPIIQKFSNTDFPFSETVYKIKVKNSSNINDSYNFELNSSVKNFLDSKKALNLDDYSEEEKIYLLHKAKTIYCSWGSSWYINVCYYISDYSDKFFHCIFHETLAQTEYDFISQIQETPPLLKGNMPLWATHYSDKQIYTSLIVNGKKYRSYTLDFLQNN
jgi:hypothetical protein